MLPLLACLASPPLLGSYAVTYGTERRSLEIGADRSFKYRSRGCFHNDLTTGRYRIDGDTLFLSPRPNDERDEFATDRYRIVAWNGASFLVDEVDLLGFAEDVRTGWRGDEESSNVLRFGPKEAREGRPTLPLPWRKTLDRPLALHAIRIQGGNVSVDAGVAEGLRVGTALQANVDGTILLVVRSVRAHDALAAWGTLDAEKPLHFTAGCPLSVATKLAPVIRMFRNNLLRGGLVPKPKDPP